MGAGSKQPAWRWAMAVALGYLVVALPLLPSYGATWDFVMAEYPYGERLLGYVLSGDEGFLALDRYEPRPTLREPHPDFDSIRHDWFQVYPFGAMLSAISCRVLWTELGLVSALTAHNLIGPLLVAGLLLAMVRFAQPRVGTLAAVGAAILLVASPRFFAHAFFNIKDVPETCLYVTATLLGYLALTRGELRWWIGAGTFTGLALAQKANALFIPPQFALFLILVAAVPAWRRSGGIRWSWRGFLLGTAVLFAAHYLVSPRYWTEPIAGPAARLGEMMRMGNRAFDEGAGADGSVALYAPLFVSTTTTPVLLILSAIGLASRRMPGLLRAFLIAGLAVTLGRNLLPGVRNFDGVRHFLEFYPYLCLAGGVGLASVVGWRPLAASRTRRAAAVALLLIGPLWQTARTHPHGIGYFNVLIGGLEGAQARNVPGATDYWGSSYLQAVDWLNQNAEPGSAVLVPIAGHIVAALAPVRLRDDLTLWRKAQPKPVTYVAFITRRGWYRAMMFELEERFEPVHTIGVQGGTLVVIYRLGEDEASRATLALWERKTDAEDDTQRILDWLEAHPKEAPGAWAILRAVNQVGYEPTLERLRAYLPEELHGGLEGVVWNQLKR